MTIVLLIFPSQQSYAVRRGKNESFILMNGTLPFGVTVFSICFTTIYQTGSGCRPSALSTCIVYVYVCE